MSYPSFIVVEYEKEVTSFEAPGILSNVLVQLFDQPPEAAESPKIEVKGWCCDEKDLADKVSDAAACLANADGGCVIVGISKEGAKYKKFSPCPYPNVNPSWLLARVHDLTCPPVECHSHDLTKMVNDDLGVAHANVYALVVPRTKHVSGHMTVKGISKIRVGKECKPYYTAEDDRTRMTVPEASTDDLSITAVRWAMSAHCRKFQAPEHQWPEPWDFLVQARLLEPYLPDEEFLPRYRVPLATLILFGKQAALSKHAPYLETLVITDQGDVRIRKNVVDTLHELTGTEQALITSICPSLPRAMVHEVVVNALVHRCYRTAGPVVIRLSESHIEIQNPGELLSGLAATNLIYCVPVYRNLLLADGARFIGLCDKIGQGIDLVVKAALSGGFDLPAFESENNLFTARISREYSAEFSEFVLRRSQAFPALDELLALRLLWSQEHATLLELSSVMQRGHVFARRVLEGMLKKFLIERVNEREQSFRLTSAVRRDIERIFESDQLGLGFRDE